MIYSKIRKKLWRMSSVLFIFSIIASILDPTTLIPLLPINISMGSLTIGIPIYSIVRYIKEKNNDLSRQKLNSKEIDMVIIEDDIIKEKIVDKQDSKNYELVEQHYKEEIIQEKNKVKTKGVIAKLIL